MFNIVKSHLTLPVDFSVDPRGCYVRIGKVEKVFLRSRAILIQFIDGERDLDADKYVEDPIWALAVIGSMDPATTYVPSAVVYGRGDLCSVMCLGDGTYLAVSPLEMNEMLNRTSYPTLKTWALFDVLNGINVDGLHDEVTPENSYLTFWEPSTYITVTITGNPEDNKLFEQMLIHWTRERTNTIPFTRNWGAWYFDMTRSGPDNNYEKKIDGNTHKGRYVNGFPYVEYEHFFNDVTTVKNDMTAFHPTITGLTEGLPHPLGGALREPRHLDSVTVVWFDDIDPTHVLIIGSHTAWDGAKNIIFAEVPVYSLAGRKKLEEEITFEDELNEERKTVETFQMYSDQVRILKIIPRDYIDWSAHESSVAFSERLHKSISVYIPRFTGDTTTYGILDGYGYGQGGTVFDLNKQTEITGEITRYVGDENATPYANGSRNTYLITNTNPIDGYHTLYTGVRFQYNWNGGAEWESQNIIDNTVEFKSFNDGKTTMHRRVDLDYYCDGHYDMDATGSGVIAWSDGQDGTVADVQDITNNVYHYTFRQGEDDNDPVVRWTEHSHFRKTSTDGMWGWGTQYLVYYADVDYDLFVMEKIVTNITQGSCFLGPGYTCTGTQIHYGIVMFEGTQYIIWQYEITLTVMPVFYNFWPWLLDSNSPERPTATPYATDVNYTSPFWHWPHFTGSLGTLKSGYTTIGLGAPGPLFSPESIPFNFPADQNDDLWRDDLFRVHIDKAADSFAIKWQCYMVDDTDKVLSYPSTGDTLLRFNGGTPHFNIPISTVTIDL